MLDDQIKAQLKGYFERIQRPIELVASLEGGDASRETLELLQEIAALSDRIALVTDGDDKRKPSFAIRPAGDDAVITFAGLPMGHEFNSLVLALLQAGGHPPKIAPEAVEQIKGLGGEYRFETYFSQSCQNCPEVVQALNAISALNPRVRHVAIDGAAFPDETKAREIMAVPSVFLNGEPFGQGRMSLDEILAKLDSGASARDAERLNAKAPYEVLIVGVVADVVSDNRGVAGIVFGDAGFDLSYQVSAHVRRFGVDAAAQPGEDAHQGATETEADQGMRRMLRCPFSRNL